MYLIQSIISGQSRMDGLEYWYVVPSVVMPLSRHEGLQGFYRGFVPHILRVAPTAGVTFVVYEQCLKSLSKLPS